MSDGRGLADPKLQAVIAEVQAISPQPADRWEIAAILESLGYTDRHLQAEFNYSDSLALGSEIYDYLRENGYLISAPTPLLQPARKSWSEELLFFGTRFAQSFLYAIPFIASILLESFFARSDEAVVPLQLSALMTPALMASLITSGGFVQMIQRRGSFYQNMDQSIHVQRACRPIFLMGVVTSLALGILGVAFGFYRSYAGDNYLIIGAFYYVVLCIMWQTFAMVSLRYNWSTPVALIGIALLFVFCRLGLNLDAVTCQIVTMTSALVGMMAMWSYVYFQDRRQEKLQPNLPDLPSSAAVTYLLTPYFLYGLAYFGFLFADRFAAGWVLEKYSSLSFAVDNNYQHPMDLALLNFLVMIPFVEYLADKFSYWWYGQAQQATSRNIGAMSKKLQRCYYFLSRLLLATCFLVGIVTILLMMVMHQSYDAIYLTAFGALGYSILSVGLWNAIILLVLNRISVVLKILLPAVVVNLICGYILGNLWGVAWVPIGLVLGSIMFTFMASRQVLYAIRQADYCYFYSGY
jgi:O-antigen/teichoic acid export membrane protein